MYSSNYTFGTFCHSKNQSLNCLFHLQNQCHYRCYSLLILLCPMIYHAQWSSIWIFATSALSLWGLFSIALLCWTRPTSFPFAWDFLFPFMEVASWLDSYQNAFNLLFSSFNQAAIQVRTFVMLCSE